jgi:hypothetical protein
MVGLVDSLQRRPAMMMRRIAFVSVLTSVAMGGTVAAQERGTKMIPERPGRVFVMAGFDTACKALAPVQITIDRQPEKGSVAFRENQETTIQYSVSGRCVGNRIRGTGIYYTARAGASGTDTFAVTARIGGETASRTFTVNISDE